MARSLSVITAASTDILTVAEVKEHLRVDTTADDTLIGNLIKAATQSAEIFTNRYFIETEVFMYCDKWSEMNPLLKSPVSDIVNIKYFDTDEVDTLWATANYDEDISAQPARIGLSQDGAFPTTANRIAAIKVRYKVGYGTSASDVPEGIKQAVLLTIGNWYENRQEVVVGRVANILPKSAQFLLEQYKIQTC